MNETQRSVTRYVDGEMSRDEAIAFEVQIRDDAALREAVAELRALRGLFGPERGAEGARPSAGFRSRVMAAAAAEREAAPVAAAIELWGRRVLVAAAVLVATALVVAVSVLRSTDTGRLEASPAEVQRAIDALDARIRAEQGAAEGR